MVHNLIIGSLLFATCSIQAFFILDILFQRVRFQQAKLLVMNIYQRCSTLVSLKEYSIKLSKDTFIFKNVCFISLGNII